MTSPQKWEQLLRSLPAKLRVLLNLLVDQPLDPSTSSRWPLPPTEFSFNRYSILITGVVTGPGGPPIYAPTPSSTREPLMTSAAAQLIELAAAIHQRPPDPFGVEFVADLILSELNRLKDEDPDHCSTRASLWHRGLMMLTGWSETVVAGRASDAARERKEQVRLAGIVGGGASVRTSPAIIPMPPRRGGAS
jgi:hypothetical protein